jgi:hypothetical protein
VGLTVLADMKNLAAICRLDKPAPNNATPAAARVD